MFSMEREVEDYHDRLVKLQRKYRSHLKALFVLALILSLYGILRIFHILHDYTYDSLAIDKVIAIAQVLQWIGAAALLVVFFCASHTRKASWFAYLVAICLLEITLRLILSIELVYCHYDVWIEGNGGRASCQSTLLGMAQDAGECLGVCTVFVLIGLLANSASALVKGTSRCISDIKRHDRSNYVLSQ